MKLEEVLPAFREGKAIRRKCWYPERYLCLKNMRTILSSSVDIDTDDWEIVEPPKQKVKRWLWVYADGFETKQFSVGDGLFTEEEAKSNYGSHLICKYGEPIETE